MYFTFDNKGYRFTIDELFYCTPMVCSSNFYSVQSKYGDMIIFGNAFLNKYVAEFDYDEKTNTWLCSFYKFFEMLKPDILYHENTTELNLGRQIISNEFKVKLIERERTALITTTKIIEKIKKL